MQVASERMIDQKLLVQEAKRLAIRNDEELLAQMVAQMEQQAGGRDSLESMLAAGGSSVEQAIALLRELNDSLPVWIELGVQTSCDRTLSRLNRGHGWDSSRAAIQRLHAAGLQTIVHVILGLPGEGREEMDATATALADLPVDGIKLHNLHVIAGTALATSYAAAPFPLLNEHAYAEALIRFLRLTPATTVIHRLTTDTPEPALVAPHWSLAKGQFITYLERLMEHPAHHSPCMPFAADEQ